MSADQSDGLADRADGRPQRQPLVHIDTRHREAEASNPAQPMTIYGAEYHGVGGLSAQAQITSIAAAPDGKVWFTDVTSYNNAPKGALGWIDPANPSTVNEVPIPSDKLGIASYDSRIIAGPSGSIWFTEATLSGGAVTSSKIAVYFPSSGQIGEIPLSAASQKPLSLAVGPDNNVWFTESQASGGSVTASAVGVIDLSAASPNLTEFPLTKPNGGSVPQPFRIIAGPDGYLWFTDSTNQAIDFINPASKAVGTVPITHPLAAPAIPQGLTTGPDGNIWFTDSHAAFGVAALDTRLVVTAQPPAAVQPGAPFSLTVAVQYSDTGALKTAYNGPVSVALASNPGGSVLNGTLTVTASGGVATFNGLSLSNVGTGYTVVASAPGIAGSAATGSFDVSTTALRLPRRPCPRRSSAARCYSRGRPTGRASPSASPTSPASSSPSAPP